MWERPIGDFTAENADLAESDTEKECEKTATTSTPIQRRFGGCPRDRALSSVPFFSLGLFGKLYL
jgi:hypothetical protein